MARGLKLQTQKLAATAPGTRNLGEPRPSARAQKPVFMRAGGRD